MLVGHGLSTRYNQRVGRREGGVRLFRYDGVFLGGLPGDVALPFARRVHLAPGEQTDNISELPPGCQLRVCAPADHLHRV